MKIAAFQEDLLAWYEQNKRDLPWRKNKDPYRIWVSEVMLQQTRVDTVIPYYNRFMEQFPTLEAFARADESQFLKAWEGLGYYSRVRNLHQAVNDVVASYGGIVPNTVDEMKKLKGVGDYTAGAVASIAYDVAAPAVDGNVMRVYARIFNIDADIAAPASKKIFIKKVEETVAHHDPSSFNQALMELGALVCTPKNPQCLLCPVREYCQAYELGRETELPIKRKKQQAKRVQLISAMIRNAQGEILIRKRPEKGLLAGLWEFPTLEVADNALQSSEAIETTLADHLGITLFDVEKIGDIRHVFTHLIWEVAGFEAFCEASANTKANQLWVSEKELSNYTFPTVFQKLYICYQHVSVKKGIV